jgi:amidase
VNPQLNAVIHPLFEKARDAARSPELPDGPFRGVPFVMKDVVCHTAGDPYHAGTKFLKEVGWVEEHDTELARRYRAAGFVFVGKTNTPEFAMSATTEPLAYGPSRNPWNLDHSTGGSSGGTAAAVAAGLAPLGHGNDMGGSIRIPSAHCGLVGLKPTRARNSLAPDHGEYWGPLTHEHVLTRSVRDSAAVLDATAGPATGDPYSAPAPARPWADEVGADPGRLRIGFRTDPGRGLNVDAACVRAVENTAKLLTELGHTVEPVVLEALDAKGLNAGFGVIAGAGLARDLDRWGERLGRPIVEADIEPLNWSMAQQARTMTAVAYVAAVELLQAYARGVAAWWDEGFDVLLTPTAAAVPAKIGELAPLGDPKVAVPGMLACTPFTIPFNATGQPAMSLPLHMSDDGLPIGIQLVARYGREDVLVRLASQLETAQPWSERLPAIHA